jgi:hypothetical protein
VFSYQGPLKACGPHTAIELSQYGASQTRMNGEVLGSLRRYFFIFIFIEVLGSLRRCKGGGGENKRTLTHTHTRAHTHVCIYACMYVCMCVYVSLSRSLSLSLALACAHARALSLSRREQSPTRGGRRSASHGPLSMAGCLETNPPLPPKASHGPLSMAGCL